ncbi:hypothetical protein GCM10010359_24090 [Streptomyces morookaense]|nr:hypothetical protein GCM10010359_24090 [Streptomyces morookaense]
MIDDQQPELGTLTSRDAWHQWRDRVVARYRAQGAWPSPSWDRPP